MCRGLGKTQLRLLRMMRGGRYFDVRTLASHVYNHRPAHITNADPPTTAQLVAVRRALASLAKLGRVHRDGRKWTRDRRRVLDDTIRRNHYLGSMPTRPVMHFEHDGAVLIFALPGNKNLSQWLLGKPNAVLELSRMWAPSGHRPNLLTEAMARAIAVIRREHPQCEAIISYSDPNVGHSGGTYRAASWVALGEADEDRYYTTPNGRPVSRRRFHSGSNGRDTKAEIKAAGYIEERRAPKLRFAFGLTRQARRAIERKRHSVAAPGGPSSVLNGLPGIWLLGRVPFIVSELGNGSHIEERRNVDSIESRPLSGGRGMHRTRFQKRIFQKERKIQKSDFFHFSSSSLFSVTTRTSATLAGEIGKPKLFTTCEFCMISVALIPVMNYYA
jgi:hypothetical protein